MDVPYSPLGSVTETLLTPFGILPPVIRLAAGVRGKDTRVNSSRAGPELGWESRVSHDKAMLKLKNWADTGYQ
jgi:hypothetical protein